MEWMNAIQDPNLRKALGFNIEEDNKQRKKGGSPVLLKRQTNNNCSKCSSLEWRKEIGCMGFGFIRCNNKEIYSTGYCKECYNNCRRYNCRKCKKYNVLSYNLLCHNCNEFEHNEEIKQNTHIKIYWSTYHCEPVKGKCKDCHNVNELHLDGRCAGCRNSDIKYYLISSDDYNPLYMSYSRLNESL
jgi:hypothetical protein